MEDWSKDFFQMLNQAVEAVDEFLVELAEAVETAIEQVHTTVMVEIEQYLQELCEPLSELDLEELEETAQFDPFIFPREEPTLEKHPACIGCRHYHGQIYGGNLLVCAMHPYGWDDANCPDWETAEL
ncbi:MAG: hypothetical protein KME17_06500 [Cyanosarcina radialis HA8281-LM2]|jgi:hypothetical protein|nr:hypothetical protein [Cyanosarcina radialis HA8281-LM2]